MPIGRLIALSATLVFFLVGAGCSPQEAIRKWTPPEDDKLAREFMDDLRRGQSLEAEMLLAPEIRRGNVEAGIQQLVSLFRSSAKTNVKQVGVNISETSMAGASRKVISLSYEVESSAGWVAGTITIVDEGGERLITGARFNRLPASLEALNRFTFREKNSVFYWYFALLVAVPLFSLSTLVLCVRTQIKYKWLWVIAILIGVVTFRLNWTTGHVDWALLNFQLLGASMLRTGAYGPWMIAISLPVGAIVFRLKRRFMLAGTSVPARLFTPGQATLACACGGPLAGCWLMARNYLAWAQKRAAWWTISIGLAATSFLLVIGLLLRHAGTGTEFSLAGLIAVKWAATALQGSAVAAHRAEGRPIQSWWKPVGLGLLFMAATLSAVMLLLALRSGAGR